MHDIMTDSKTLHFIWFGNPMPDHLRQNIIAWAGMHPDWNMNLWTESNLPKLRNQDLFDNAPDLVPDDAVYQFRADLARYELLYNMGGFYADVDTRPLKRINGELRGHDVFAAMEDRNWVGNTYLGSVPGHLIMREIIGAIPGNVKRNLGHRPNVLTGPKFLTPIWKRRGGYTAPSARFFPYLYSEVRSGKVPTTFSDEVVAVHEWFHTESVIRARRRRSASLRHSRHPRVPLGFMYVLEGVNSCE
jgi:mannosyltransferase OCH1-like enzyme